MLSAGSAGCVSARARRRGLPQLGTLGAGNHYAEIQVIDRIYDKHAAAKMGLRAAAPPSPHSVSESPPLALAAPIFSCESSSVPGEPASTWEVGCFLQQDTKPGGEGSE